MLGERKRCSSRSHDISVINLFFSLYSTTLLIPGYSVGHHSTSDDSFAYRAREEVENRVRLDNPIVRFRLFMESRGWWSKQEDEELKARLKNDVMAAFKHADSLKRFELKAAFEDVYGGEQPWNIVCPSFTSLHFTHHL
jgi:Dehydrogenase E1 component